MSQYIFSNEIYKQKIMKGIFDLCQIQDSDVVTYALQAFIEIARQNYECMDLYLNQIYQMTQSFLSNVGQDDDEKDKLARLMIEVWNTLCETEI